MRTPQATPGSTSALWHGVTDMGTAQQSNSVQATGTDYGIFIEAVFEPSANGTVQVQGASEVGSSQVIFGNYGAGELIDLG